VSVTPATQQYSDLVTFKATISPASIQGNPPALSVTFYVGTQSMGTAPLLADGTATLSNVALLETVAGQMAPGTPTVTAVFNSVNTNFTVSNPTTSLTIKQEDATASYTGVLYASTGSSTSTAATVVLSATVKDITATDPNTDPNPGDIRNATVTFVNRDTIPNTVIATVPVGLVTLSDKTVATATYNWAVNIQCSSPPCSATYTIGVIVGNYYTRNSSFDDGLVTVAQPGNNFITAGGYLTMQNSAGQYPGAAGTKNNFGFNVKYNKQGTNLQGNINTIIRNNGRTYQVKGNSMTSLSVQPSPCPGGTLTSPCAAVFTGKASIQDITDPLNAISIDGNATLKVTMTDKGSPSSDSIGITVWNKLGGLWFSSD